MNYFCILEQCQRGDLDFGFLIASETAFTDFYGAIPPKAQEVFQGIDFVGAPSDSFLWVMPRQLVNIVVISPDGDPAPTTPRS